MLNKLLNTDILYMIFADKRLNFMSTYIPCTFRIVS